MFWILWGVKNVFILFKTEKFNLMWGSRTKTSVKFATLILFLIEIRIKLWSERSYKLAIHASLKLSNFSRLGKKANAS